MGISFSACLNWSGIGPLWHRCRVSALRWKHFACVMAVCLQSQAHFMSMCLVISLKLAASWAHVGPVLVHFGLCETQIFFSVICSFILTHWCMNKNLTFFLLNEKRYILIIHLPLKFVLEGPINTESTLVQVIAWCPPGIKLLADPMMTKILFLDVIRCHWATIS